MWNTLHRDQEDYTAHTINLKYVHKTHEKFFLPNVNYTVTEKENSLLSFIYKISKRCDSDTETLFIYEDSFLKIKSIIVKHDQTFIYLYKYGVYHITSPATISKQSSS